jgi:hypothetical protein
VIFEDTTEDSTSDDSKSSLIANEIQSWQSFGEILRSNDRKLFVQMLDECLQFSDAVNSKGELYSTESLLMALILNQQKIIRQLMLKHRQKSMQPFMNFN